MEALLADCDESYHLEEINVRVASPTGGQRVAVQARYVHVLDVPPNVSAKIRFGTSTADALPIKPGETYPTTRGRSARAIFVEWTQDESASTSGDRYLIKLAFGDDRMMLLANRRTEVYEAPATGGSTGQKKIAAAGTAEALSSSYSATEAVMVTASPNNSTGVALGFSNTITNLVDGTGTGDVLWPGQSKTFAIDSASRLYMNAQSTSDMVSWVNLNSRR